MPKLDLFGGMNIDLIKVTPSPTYFFLFAFINLPLTTPVSRLLQRRNKAKGECTVVHDGEFRFMNIICHQHGDFWGEKYFSSTNNK